MVKETIQQYDKRIEEENRLIADFDSAQETLPYNEYWDYLMPVIYKLLPIRALKAYTNQLVDLIMKGKHISEVHSQVVRILKLKQEYNV